MTKKNKKGVEKKILLASIQELEEEKRGKAAIKQAELPINYKYEELGKDHNKDVEYKKEKERQKKRNQIYKQLEVLDTKKKNISKEMQSQAVRSGLDMPSFVIKPSSKLEYKKLLLQQIEIDKEKRKLSKQYDRLKGQVIPQDETKSNESPEKKNHLQPGIEKKKEKAKVNSSENKLIDCRSCR